MVWTIILIHHFEFLVYVTHLSLRLNKGLRKKEIDFFFFSNLLLLKLYFFRSFTSTFTALL